MCLDERRKEREGKQVESRRCFQYKKLVDFGEEQTENERNKTRVMMMTGQENSCMVAICKKPHGAAAVGWRPKAAGSRRFGIVAARRSRVARTTIAA